MWRLVHLMVLFTLTQVRASFLLLTRLIPFHYAEYKVSVFSNSKVNLKMWDQNGIEKLELTSQTLCLAPQLFCLTRPLHRQLFGSHTGENQKLGK